MLKHVLLNVDAWGFASICAIAICVSYCVWFIVHISDLAARDNRYMLYKNIVSQGGRRPLGAEYKAHIRLQKVIMWELLKQLEPKAVLFVALIPATWALIVIVIFRSLEPF